MPMVVSKIINFKMQTNVIQILGIYSNLVDEDMGLCNYNWGAGWDSIVIDCFEKVKTINETIASEYPVQVVQIKEKFGGLRFYLNLYPEEIIKFIEERERESFRVCEDCGSNDPLVRRRGKSWIRTLCVKCGNEYEKI